MNPEDAELKKNLAKAQSIAEARSKEFKLGRIRPYARLYLPLAAALFVIIMFALRKSLDASRYVASHTAFPINHASAQIDVDYIMQVENLDYYLKYKATAGLVNATGSGINTVVINELRGSGE